MINSRLSLCVCALLICGTIHAAQVNTQNAMQAQPASSPAQNQPPVSTLSAPATGTSGESGIEQSPFGGSVPSGPAQPGVLSLSLSDAINRGLRYNLGLLLSDQATKSARGARWQALSNLLPDISAGLTETREQINLQALGFPSGFPGVPIIVGPFNVFDARGSVDQSILNFKYLNQARGESENVKAARYTYQNARDLVVLVAANMYLQAVAGSSRVSAAQAEVATSQALYNRAQDLHNAGLVPGIDVLRSQVELQSQQQRLIVFQNELQKDKLNLARAIGLPLAQAFQLTDKVPYSPAPPLSFDQALGQALHSRSDYQSALASVKAAESFKKAARSERLPSVKFHADYGDIGTAPDNSHETFTVMGTVKIPIFQGGKVKGDVLQADALLKQRQSRLEDLRSRIEYQVRTAFLDLRSSGDQVQVAQHAQKLAHQQLTQSQDRFAAGVVNSLEVVQSQEAVATADENYISSLYRYNVAKAQLARALGVAEQAFKQMIGGKP